MPPQEGGQEQTRIGADGGGKKSVDVGENRGLLCDSRAKQARPLRDSERRIARVRRYSVAIGRQPIGRLPAEAIDMQADEIGVDLLAHAHEGLHEGGSDLAAEQAAGLEQRPDRQHIGGTHRLNRENDDRRQRERLPDGLQNLRGKKVVGGPILRKTGSHERGDSDQDRADRKDPTRIDTRKKPAERKDDKKLRQRDPYEYGADLQ